MACHVAVELIVLGCNRFVVSEACPMAVILSVGHGCFVVYV